MSSVQQKWASELPDWELVAGLSAGGFAAPVLLAHSFSGGVAHSRIAGCPRQSLRRPRSPANPCLRFFGAGPVWQSGSFPLHFVGRNRRKHRTKHRTSESKDDPVRSMG